MMGSPGQDHRYFDNQQFYLYPCDGYNDRRYDSSIGPGLRSNIIAKVADKTSTHNWPIQQQRPLQPRSYDVPTKTKKTGPVVWKGIINCAKTGEVNVKALDMIGSTDLLDLEMPSSLDIIGRIRPKLMWAYVNQTMRSGTRDILVFKFSPASEADRKHYSPFLSHITHLYKKHNRLAVVGSSKLIKNFYVVPLPKDSPIPSALVSLSTAFNENRTTCLLLGVVVLAKKKREVDEIVSVPHKAAKLTKISAKTTPPSSASPKRPCPLSNSSSSLKANEDVEEDPISKSELSATTNSTSSHYSAPIDLDEEYKKLDREKAAIEAAATARKQSYSIENDDSSDEETQILSANCANQSFTNYEDDEDGLLDFCAKDGVSTVSSEDVRAGQKHPLAFVGKINNPAKKSKFQVDKFTHESAGSGTESQPSSSADNDHPATTTRMPVKLTTTNRAYMLLEDCLALETIAAKVPNKRAQTLTKITPKFADQMEEDIVNDAPDSPDFTNAVILPTQDVLQSTMETLEEFDGIGVEDDSYWRFLSKKNFFETTRAEPTTPTVRVKSEPVDKNDFNPASVPIEDDHYWVDSSPLHPSTLAPFERIRTLSTFKGTMWIPGESFPASATH